MLSELVFEEISLTFDLSFIDQSVDKANNGPLKIEENKINSDIESNFLIFNNIFIRKV